APVSGVRFVRAPAKRRQNPFPGSTPAPTGDPSVRARGSRPWGPPAAVGHDHVPDRRHRPRHPARTRSDHGRCSMRRYETMIIITDALEEEAAVAAFDRAKEILAQQGGTLLDEAWWGRRKFGYEINKRDFG